MDFKNHYRQKGYRRGLKDALQVIKEAMHIDLNDTENSSWTGWHSRGGFDEVVTPNSRPKTLTDKQRADALNTAKGMGAPKYNTQWDPDSQHVEIHPGGYALNAFDEWNPTENNGRSREVTSKANSRDLKQMPRCTPFPSDEEIEKAIAEYEDDATRVKKVESYLNSIFRKGSRAGHSFIKTWHFSRDSINSPAGLELHGIVWILPDTKKGGSYQYEADKKDVLADKGKGAAKKSILVWDIHTGATRQVDLGTIVKFEYEDSNYEVFEDAEGNMFEVNNEGFLWKALGSTTWKPNEHQRTGMKKQYAYRKKDEEDRVDGVTFHDHPEITFDDSQSMRGKSTKTTWRPKR